MSWQIDPTNSQIRFAIRKLGLITVHGEFTRFAGTLTLDETEPTRSAIGVHIAAASIDTGIPRRDDHLRSADFFDVERYPILAELAHEAEAERFWIGHVPANLASARGIVKAGFRRVGVINSVR
jgi:YceI-like protein